jgi:hypothetical protein
MGATFLTDHHAIYRKAGIKSLMSFGRDEDDVMRQRFNRPTSRMECIQMNSADLADSLTDSRKGKKLVLWLDFMSPAERRSQLQEIELLCSKLELGDIVRITLNADFRRFGKFDEQERKSHATVQHMAASKLKRQLYEYLPAKLELISETDLPLVLANSVSVAFERGLKNRDLLASPLLTTTYADGDRMVTVAVRIGRPSEQKLPEAIRTWEHRSKSWDDIRYIDVPDLSLREKYHIDGKLANSAAKILASLPFKPKDARAANELLAAISSYRDLHRYYPAFHHFEG